MEISVKAGGGYTVTVSSGLLGGCGDLLMRLPGRRDFAVVTDEHVAPIYLNRVLDSLRGAGCSAFSVVIPAGEQAKSMATLGYLLEELASGGLSRGGCVVALGGGVVGDIAGFAAGCYMRGVSFVQMPTTLLAAVDSSVGGKTAVDLDVGKNLAGLFVQPNAVLCDTDCLDTLPSKNMAEGAAEAIKTAMIGDAGLFELICEDGIKHHREEVIARCVKVKAGIVERDEFECGERKLLNLGHTAGHAIELLSGYEVSHGYAVAAGIAITARAARRRGWCPAEDTRAIVSALEKLGLPVATRYTPEQLAVAALNDKKRERDSIILAVPRKIGCCTLEKLHVDELCRFFSDGTEGTA